jgi:predicted Zn finger-like uncharacterized protein
MAIEFECPACRTLVRVADSAAGAAVRCGSCEAVVTAPAKPPPVRSAEPAHDEDPFDRPQPRRRRPPPRPQGRGGCFWAAVIGGGLFVLVALACGGMFLLTGTPNWRTFDSVRGGYQVELPADPLDDLAEQAGVPPQQGIELEGTILPGRLEQYVIVFGAVPPPGQRPGTDDEIMDTAIRDAVGKEISRVVGQKPVTVSGFPARELEVELRDGGKGVGRLVIAETKFYMVLAGGPFTDPSNERFKRFVDSFQVTDPAQLAARKEREEAGRRPKVNPFRKGAGR